MGEQEFWAEETQRRMAEYNQRALAAAQRQQAVLAQQPDLGLDAARHRANREYETMRARELAESAATHKRAVAAKHAKMGYIPLGELDWDALSTEAKIDRMHAEDAAAQASAQQAQQAQLDALMNTPALRLQRWRTFQLLYPTKAQQLMNQDTGLGDIPSGFK